MEVKVRCEASNGRQTLAVVTLLVADVYDRHGALGEVANG